MDLKLNLVVYLNDTNHVEKRHIKDNLKKCLENCGVSVKIWNDFNSDLPTTDTLCNGKSKPVFGDLSVEVYCEAVAQSSYFSYERLRNNWFSIVSQYFPGEDKPLLNFKDNKAYRSERRNVHHVNLTKVSFGTLVTPTSYVEHVVPGVNYFCYHASFNHDSSNLVVEIRPIDNAEFFFDDFNFERKKTFFDNFKLNYGSIKLLVVNNDNSLVLELINSPTLHCGFKRYVEITTLKKDTVARSNAICLTFSSTSEFQGVVSRMHSRCKTNGTPVYFCPFSVRCEPMPSLTVPIYRVNMLNLDFSCKYLLEAIVRRNCRLQLQNLESFLQRVCVLWGSNHDVTEEALSDLVRLCDTGHSFNYLSSLNILYNWYLRQANFRLDIMSESKKVTKVRCAIITPTRILLWPAEICIQNRIIRNFDKEYALRVSFRDEDYLKLSFRSCRDDAVVNNTVYDSMVPWITIAGRYFEFLAWSNSQIRDHGVWMYAGDTTGKTAAYIRGWMGDFSNITCIPKYMARMGQCFSQTQDSGKRFDVRHRVITERDIERGFDPESRRPYCFSDGIGRISTQVVDEILEDLGIVGCPCAFQIRFGGYKGMLVLDPTLKEYDMVFRDSMKKFICENSKTLEICKVSFAGSVGLNRPLITILNQNGIENHVFLRLQEDALENLTGMFFDDAKAGHYLQGHDNMGMNFTNLVQSGISPTIDPFLRGMLLAAHLTAVDKILNKANLPIDPTEGRNMFGVLDETRKLNYGEVFVQYTKHIIGQETNTKTIILEGPVMVTKNPCYQAGDVRILWARNVPELKHIKDCIVFPQNGDRPHPNEMEGSDLDGDEYTVIWKKDIIFPRNKPPSHFPVPKNPVAIQPIKVPDMVAFLCDYISSDNIGMIASSHLAFADRAGIESYMCQNIARKCSLAVDYAKNGEKVDLEKHERPTEYPDFMQKSNKHTYKSRRSLGVLFRTCNAFCEYTVSTGETYANVIYDPYLEYDGWKEYEISAKESRDKYFDRLETILMTYGIRNESEAMTNCFSKLHGRYNYYKDRNEIEELVKINIAELKKVMAKEFLVEFSDIPTPDTRNILRKASAWYMVTYTQGHAPRFLSFPWIVEKYLCQIKQINLLAKNQKVPINAVLSKFQLKLKDLEPELRTLTHNINSVLLGYANDLCPLSEWSLASRMLIEWAYYNNLTSICNLDNHSVVHLLIHAYKVNETKEMNAISLILTFLKFFMSLRFKRKGMTFDKLDLPFFIQKLNVLAKESMTTYRHVAITGTFESFKVFKGKAVATEMEEMDPIHLSANAKGFNSVELLRRKLAEWSQCNEVQVREDQQCLKVSAWGTMKQNQKLRSILNKGPEAISKSLSYNTNPLKY